MVSRLERESVLTTGLQICGVKLPERAFRVGHPTLDATEPTRSTGAPESGLLNDALMRMRVSLTVGNR